MSRAATYWAVPADLYAEAVEAEDVGEALADYMFNDKEWPNSDIADVFEPLDWTLTGGAAGMVDEANLLSVAVNGRTQHDVTDTAMLDPELVSQVQVALSALDADWLRARIDLAQMDRDRVSPGGFAGKQGWEDAIVESLEELQRFYATAARQGMAVLVDIA